MTCTQAMGSATPASRCMCAASRRLESYSRIFLRAIVRVRARVVASRGLLLVRGGGAAWRAGVRVCGRLPTAAAAAAAVPASRRCGGTAAAAAAAVQRLGGLRRRGQRGVSAAARERLGRRPVCPAALAPLGFPRCPRVRGIEGVAPGGAATPQPPETTPPRKWRRSRTRALGAHLLAARRERVDGGCSGAASARECVWAWKQAAAQAGGGRVGASGTCATVPPPPCTCQRCCCSSAPPALPPHTPPLSPPCAVPPIPSRLVCFVCHTARARKLNQAGWVGGEASDGHQEGGGGWRGSSSREGGSSRTSKGGGG